MSLDLGIGERSEAILGIIEKHSSVDNNYIKSGEMGALVGNRLAGYLGLQRGDTIVLLGQGYHGSTAAGKYVIEGVVSLPEPELESRIVYLPVDVCQDLYGADGMLTSLAIQLRDKDDSDVDKTIERLNQLLDPPLRVLGWREMNETIVQQMEADNSSGMIMIGILYLVIAFGVFGTVLMMTAERRREFGVIISIGMQKTRMAAVMVYEMVYIGIIGIAAGIAVALPSIIYGFYHPIRLSGEIAKMMEDYGFEPVMAFKWIDTYFLWQSLVVGVIVLLSVIYPVRNILKLEINAL
ncbi:MAG: FtsX-like permease family protein [Bacteroidales bacterium]